MNWKFIIPAVTAVAVTVVMVAVRRKRLKEKQIISEQPKQPERPGNAWRSQVEAIVREDQEKPEKDQLPAAGELIQKEYQANLRKDLFYLLQEIRQICMEAGGVAATLGELVELAAHLPSQMREDQEDEPLIYAAVWNTSISTLQRRDTELQKKLQTMRELQQKPDLTGKTEELQREYMQLLKENADEANCEKAVREYEQRSVAAADTWKMYGNTVREDEVRQTRQVCESFHQMMESDEVQALSICPRADDGDKKSAIEAYWQKLKLAMKWGKKVLEEADQAFGTGEK